MSKSAIIKTFLLILFGIFSGCSTPVVNEMPEEETVEVPDHESWDVRITITDAGVKRATIQADYLEKFDDKLFTSLKNNVKIYFYDANENPMSTLSADKAEINERTNFLRAMSNIVVESDSGITLFTDTLSWDNKNETVFTDDSVMITTETNDTLYGIGFESDVNMEHWKILKPHGVTGR